MRIPSAINLNTLEAYKVHPSIIAGCNTSLQSFNLETWDLQLPNTLQEICIETIAKNWTDNPLLDEIVLVGDRYLLLDILKTDLPLKLTIPKIPDDVYWRRCYIEKWPKQLPDKVRQIEIKEIYRDNDIRKLSTVYSASGSSGSRNSLTGSQGSQVSRKSQRTSARGSNKHDDERTWKEYYIEMFLKEYLENLKPEEYDDEKMKELIHLCSPYTKRLRIQQLQCTEKSPNRIPLNSVLNGFNNLKELSICFKQTYIGEQFTWNVLRTTSTDIKLLARGLEKLRLHTLRIINSDINCDKSIIILKALLRQEIKIIDFCHCKIADKGLLGISKFITEVRVRELLLANNKIGPKGMEYLTYALCQPNCEITKLDLHLNKLGDVGGNLLLAALNRQHYMKSIVLSGCGFSDTINLGPLLKANNSLEHLDFSNNKLGEKVGQEVLQAMRFNSTIKKFDLRMCRIPTNTEFEIEALLNMKKRIPPPSSPVQSEGHLEINIEEIRIQFETILN